ncbi:TPA: hypothetical protein R4X75_000079 [Klebsiella pneumoniae]|nr:hypothetical protein [Klebsiella pneumoniae]
MEKKLFYENLLLIVLYDKHPKDSKTIASILQNDSLNNTKVILWNNGPSRIEIADAIAEFRQHGYLCDFIETIENNSLAYIYNYVIANFSSKRYILLDHDSSLTTNYLQDLKLVETDQIGMPQIFFKRKLVNPCLDFLPYAELNNRKSFSGPIMTIGSGLVIGRELIDKLEVNFQKVFDERFYLYGVDTTFCLRLYKASLSNSIVFIRGVEHSLSRLESETGLINEFRRKERSCDLALRIRYYTPRAKWAKELGRVFLSALKKKILGIDQQYDLKMFSTVFIKGKHLRDLNRF